MSTQSRFPSREADLNDYINISVSYLNANQARLIITPTAKADLEKVNTSLNAPETGWNTVYIICQNPAKAKSTDFADKDSRKLEIEGYLREIYADIPQSLLTNQDRLTLNLPAASTSNTAATIPTEVPAIIISKYNHLSNDFKIVDIEMPQKKAKPAGVDVIEIEGAFLPIEAKDTEGFPKDGDFRHLDTVGKTSYTRHYTQEQLKGTEYLRARYVNTRRVPGKWSAWVMNVVA